MNFQNAVGGGLILAFPDWRTALQVSAGDLMVDRVQLVCRGEYAFAQPRLRVDVISQFTRGRTPFDGRMPRGFRWINDGAGRLCLRRVSEHHGWLLEVQLIIGEPTAAHPDRMSVTATISINPTRVRALQPNVDASRCTITHVEPSVIATSQSNPRDNFFTTAELLHPGAPPHQRIDEAASILDGAVTLVGLALFGVSPGVDPSEGHGQFNSVSIRQIEIYSDFRADDPVQQVTQLHTGVQGGSRTEFNSVRIGDEAGYRTVTVPLLRADTTNAVFYSRGTDRIRAEVRYLKNVSRAVRGSTSGDTRQRLRQLAEDAARRLNRILSSTRSHRRQHLLVGRTSFGELAAMVTSVITAYERRKEIINQLCQFRHIRVGTGRLAMITIQEARQLILYDVISRVPVRSRDPDGTVYGLSSRFPDMPGGIPSGS